MGQTRTDHAEKRKYARFTYSAATRPTFRARGEQFEIKDVSKGGLKFNYKNKINIKGWVKGTIDMTDGSHFDVEGIVLGYIDATGNYQKEEI